MAIRLGLQIPSFSYGTGVKELFPTVIAQAREAESAGFDAVFVMDHFYQLPMLGSPDQPMLEAYTALGWLAAKTERVKLLAMVTAVVYREPGLLAKEIAALLKGSVLENLPATMAKFISSRDSCRDVMRFRSSSIPEPTLRAFPPSGRTSRGEQSRSDLAPTHDWKSRPRPARVT